MKFNFQVYKLFQDKWCKSNIKDLKQSDIIKVLDLDTNTYLLNKEDKETDICICDAFQDENKKWNIQSISYDFSEKHEAIRKDIIESLSGNSTSKSQISKMYEELFKDIEKELIEKNIEEKGKEEIN